MITHGQMYIHTYHPHELTTNVTFPRTALLLVGHGGDWAEEDEQRRKEKEKREENTNEKENGLLSFVCLLLHRLLALRTPLVYSPPVRHARQSSSTPPGHPSLELRPLSLVLLLLYRSSSLFALSSISPRSGQCSSIRRPTRPPVVHSAFTLMGAGIRLPGHWTRLPGQHKSKGFDKLDVEIPLLDEIGWLWKSNGSF